MKVHKSLLSATLTILIAGLLTWNSYGTYEPKQAAPAKWEYKILNYRLTPKNKFEEQEKMLNQLGEEGWEVVHLSTNVTTGNVSNYYLFKRPKR
jgi:hypothetical protein